MMPTCAKGCDTLNLAGFSTLKPVMASRLACLKQELVGLVLSMRRCSRWMAISYLQKSASVTQAFPSF